MLAVTAVRDRDFLNTLGVNTHLAYTDGLYNNSKQAVQQDLADLQYLGLDQVRDGVPEPNGTVPQANYQSALQTLTRAGIRFELVSDPSQSLTTTIDELQALEAVQPGDIIAVEGPNEINNYPITYNNMRNGDPAAQAFQKDLYLTIKSDPDLAGVSVYYYTGYGMIDPTPLNPAMTAGYADFDNQHPYPLNGMQPAAAASRASLTNENPPLGPAVFTETGYSTMPGGFFNDGSATDQAKETLNLLFDAASAGISKTYLYQLLDAYAPGSPQGDDGFGLFDYTRAPKPAATAIHNLTTILHDVGSSFTPSSLNYLVKGLPTTGNTYLMQKANGSFDLAIWNEPQIWDPVRHIDIAAPTTPLTVTLGTLCDAEIFDPLEGTSPIQILRDVNSVNLALTDHPLILELAQQISPLPTPAPKPQPAPTPTTALAIISVTSTVGSVGSPVTITGTGFGTTQGTGAVTMGIFGMAVTSWSDTKIVAAVPTQVTAGQQYDVVVALASGASIASGPPYLTVGSTAPTHAPTPTPVPIPMPTPEPQPTPGPTEALAITSVTPTTDSVGSPVTINGAGFGVMQGTGAVSMGIFGMAVISWSDTRIVAAVPTQVTAGQQYDVVIALASGASVASGPPYLTVVSTASTLAATETAKMAAAVAMPTASLTVAPNVGTPTTISRGEAGTFNVGDTFVLSAPSVAPSNLATAATIQFIGLSQNKGAANMVTVDGSMNTCTAGPSVLDIHGGGGAATGIYHAENSRLISEDFSAVKGVSLKIDATLKASLTLTADSNSGTLMSRGSGGEVDLRGLNANMPGPVH